MDVNFCPYCGTRVQEDKAFCTGCGKDLSRLRNDKEPGDFTGQLESIMKDFIENNQDLLKDLTEKIEKGDTGEKGMFFSVEMRGEKPIVRSGDLGDLEDFMEKAPLPDFVRKMIHTQSGHQETQKGLEFKEALYNSREVLNGRDVTVEMPGLETKSDVEIKKMGEKLEVIGKGQDTLYFVEVPVEDDLVVASYIVKSGILTIALRRLGGPD